MVHSRNFWIIPTSLVIALLLSIVPLPEWGRYVRPDWVAMIAIFWSIGLPRLFSVGSAWGCGLAIDVLHSSLLGQNALSLAIVVYISSRMHLQFMSAPVIQQAVFVTLLLLIKQFLSFWIAGMTGHLPPNMLLYFVPSLTALVLWPWLFIILRDISHKHRLF